MWQKRYVWIALLFVFMCNGSFLWGQVGSQRNNRPTLGNGLETTSRYSSKVFSEVDHLTRLFRLALKKQFKRLRNAEEDFYGDRYNRLIRGQTPDPTLAAPPPADGDRTANDPKDVAVIDEDFEALLRQQLEDEETEIADDLALDLFEPTFYRKPVALVTVNVYTEKNREEINRYLIQKLEGIYLKKYPRFLIYKEKEFFKYDYKELADAYVLSYGPQENAAISAQLREKNIDYYVRAYLFRLSDRTVLDVNIYNTETHEVVWGKRLSMYVSFKESNLAYRFSLGLAIELGTSTALLVTNFIGIRLPVIGIYGFFFQFGSIAVDAGGATFSLAYTAAEAVLLVVALGPQISYSLNELFGFNYYCCEVFLDFQFGYRNKITLNAASTYTARTNTLQQNFIVAIGLSLSVRKFILHMNYEILNNGIGFGAGFNF